MNPLSEQIQNMDQNFSSLVKICFVINSLLLPFQSLETFRKMLNEVTIPQPASSSHVPFTVVVVIDASLVGLQAASADPVENHMKKAVMHVIALSWLSNYKPIYLMMLCIF